MRVAEAKDGAAVRVQRLVRCVYDVEIEHGVPLPWIRGCFNAVWDKMQEGDSFKVPDGKARKAAIMSGKRCGHEVVSDKLSGEGYRVWLVKRGEAPNSEVSRER